jgi:hypothetical protein
MPGVTILIIAAYTFYISVAKAIKKTVCRNGGIISYRSDYFAWYWDGY